jgi:hypothetical protein
MMRQEKMQIFSIKSDYSKKLGLAFKRIVEETGTSVSKQLSHILHGKTWSRIANGEPGLFDLVALDQAFAIMGYDFEIRLIPRELAAAHITLVMQDLMASMEPVTVERIKERIPDIDGRKLRKFVEIANREESLDVKVTEIFVIQCEMEIAEKMEGKTWWPKKTKDTKDTKKTP